jgi:hypothetical protein
LITSVGGSNTVSFQVSSVTESNSFKYNGISYDEGTTTPFFFNAVANTISVNEVLTVTVTPATNTFVIGNSQTLTGIVTAGQPSYTYNWIVSNTAGIVFNALYVGNSFTQNTFKFTPLALGIYNAQLTVTDSATTPSIVSSSNSVISVQASVVYPINCVAGNPNINSTYNYQNTNTSTLIIFADANVPNIGYYGSSQVSLIEVVNITGANGARQTSTMSIPPQYYFRYIYSIGTNIFHCQWIKGGSSSGGGKSLIVLPTNSNSDQLPVTIILFVVAMLLIAVRLVRIRVQTVWDIMMEAGSAIFMCFVLILVLFPIASTTGSTITNSTGNTIYTINSIANAAPALSSIQFLAIVFGFVVYFLIISILLITDCPPVLFPNAPWGKKM